MKKIEIEPRREGPVENKMVFPWLLAVGLFFLLVGIWGFLTPWMKSIENDAIVTLGFIIELGVAPAILILGVIKIVRVTRQRLSNRR